MDDPRVISEHLTTTCTALYTLVGSRVYYAHLPAGYENTEPAIVFWRRGGGRHPYLDIAEGDWQFKCYGGTASFASAEAVYQALAARLHGAANQVSASGAVLDATEDGLGQAITDASTGWPYILSFYSINVRALQAA